MRSIQKLKQTPQKKTTHSHKKKMIDEVLAKDLFSPFKETFSVNLLPGMTPMRRQPQFLLSPSPVKKNLFSQLLGTQIKFNTPLEYNQSIMEEDYSFQQELSEQISQRHQGMHEESFSDNQGDWTDENGTKKRKRKSTVQIKLLKQQLDGEMNWTKQKIVRMSEVTGLSQSQVYKWCWDQKKKQNKSKQNFQNIYGDRRRIIKKQLSYRNYLPSQRSSFNREPECVELLNKQIESRNRQLGYNNRESNTKPKTNTKLDQNQSTQKKINKRLIFS